VSPSHRRGGSGPYLWDPVDRPHHLFDIEQVFD
jgi:hypothetical protein